MNWRGAAVSALAGPADPNVLAQEEERKKEEELIIGLAHAYLNNYKRGEIRGLANLVRGLEKCTDTLPPAARDRVVGHIVREANRIKQPPRPKGPNWDARATYLMVEDCAQAGYPKNPASKSPGAGDKMSAFEMVAQMRNKSEPTVRKAYYAVLATLPTE